MLGIVLLSTKLDDNMKQYLINLGFNSKEVDVYLALLEFWNQPASVISKKVWIPKSTVLFLFDGLLKKWYIRKSNKWRIQYFYADPDDLQKAKKEQLNREKLLLKQAVPLLKEFKNLYTSEPKVTFFEWIDWCKKVYSTLLDSKTEILEFWAHDDLENKLWQDFMKSFIKKRTKNKILLKWICKDNDVHKNLHKNSKNESREIRFFPKDVWNFYSSICIFENKVLLLNLFNDAFWILVENKEVSETLKTIHKLIWTK